MDEIINKYQAVEKLFKEIQEGLAAYDQYKTLISELLHYNNHIKQEYFNFLMIISPYLIRAHSGETLRNKVNNEIKRLILVENINTKISKTLVSVNFLLQKKLSADGMKTKNMWCTNNPMLQVRTAHNLFKQLCDTQSKTQWIQTLKYKECKYCHTDMVFNTTQFGLQCPNCGCIQELMGTIFDETHFYNHDGQKAKSGIFNPNRHYRFWIEHILGRNSEQELGTKQDPCGTKVLQQLKKIIKRDNKCIALLTVENIRKMLKEINRTDLNNCVSLILRKLTGVGPPQISESILLRGEYIFTEAIKIREKVCKKGRINRNYYPYYIYKIFDAILPPNDTTNRRILQYIHLQGNDTLANNDSEWESICMELPEIKWKPTDRTHCVHFF
uniref:Zinc finger protein B385R n=1 Tax=African swine fever virus TaxID=10497 RepID=A0A7R8V7I0_ASF|nr:B385R CDS [African swine fever virus]